MREGCAFRGIAATAAAGSAAAARPERGPVSDPWGAPWYQPYRALLDGPGALALAGCWGRCRAQLDALAAARGLRSGGGRALRFVDGAAAGDTPYEAHIHATGEVPTRTGEGGGWHDLFNAMVWLSFPRIKARLNELQAAAIASDGVGIRRGPLRDAATLFDENAVLLLTDDDGLVAALRAFDWKRLLLHGRDRFAERACVVVFGHALLDKLRAPYKAVCGHVWVVPMSPSAAQDELDARVAGMLDPDSLRSRAFSPLPVLGVPGWWPGNAAPGFYDDPAVFRSGRRYHGCGSGPDGRWRGNPLEEGPDSIGQGAGQRPGAAGRKTQGDGKWHREQTADGEARERPAGANRPMLPRSRQARVKR